MSTFTLSKDTLAKTVPYGENINFIYIIGFLRML